MKKQESLDINSFKRASNPNHQTQQQKQRNFNNSTRENGTYKITNDSNVDSDCSLKNTIVSQHSSELVCSNIKNSLNTLFSIETDYEINLKTKIKDLSMARPYYDAKKLFKPAKSASLTQAQRPIELNSLNKDLSVKNKINYFDKKQPFPALKVTTYSLAVAKKNEFLKKLKNPIKSDPLMHIGQFHMMRTIGRGSFGRVILSIFKQTTKFYAAKVLDKEKLVKEKQIQHLINERTVLNACEHPNIVKLQFCFKDNSYLYLIMDIACNGDLFTLIKSYRFFDENLSRFFAANVFLALEYLHVNDIIYRDLKPENILISPNGYLKLTDFGFAKRLEGQAHTICGTPDYISPEVLKKQPYGKSVDWWAFGVFIYELNKGRPPFYSKTNSDAYEKIIKCDYKIPEKFNPDLADICSKLIEIDVSKRLGCLKGESNDVRDHKWFENTDWISIYNQNYPAPFKPKFKSPVALAFEKSNFQEEKIEISATDAYKNEFIDF